MYWGDSIDLRFDVINQGTASAGPSTSGIYLSKNSTIGDSDDVLWATVSIPALNAGSYASLPYTAFNLPIINPLSGSPTSVYFGMKVDKDNIVYEGLPNSTAELNNWNQGNGIDKDTTPITINPIPMPDLLGYHYVDLTSKDYGFHVFDRTVNWGDLIHVRFAIWNRSGISSGTYKVGFYVSANSTIGDTGDFLFQKVNMTALQGNYISSWDGYVQLPNASPPGIPTQVYLGIKVDVDSEVTEWKENNNSNLGDHQDLDSSPITVTPPVAAIQVTDSVAPANDSTVDFGDVASDGAGGVKGV